MAKAKNTIMSRINRVLRCKTLTQLRDLFRREQVVGKKCNAYSCPVATFIKGAAKKTQVRVTGSDISLFNSADEKTVEVSITQPVQNFVSNFDAGKYPEFEAAH